MSHSAAVTALYSDVATVLRKTSPAGKEAVDGKHVVENSLHITVRDVLNHEPVTSVSHKVAESIYHSPYELYHDLKLVTAALISQHEIGTDEYNELRDLFSASVDLLLREGVRLYGMLPREPVQTADSFLSLIRQGLEDVFTDVQGYYSEAFYLVAQNGPLFTTQTGKSPADPRPTVVGGPIHTSKLIPLVAPAPDEVMGFAVPPPDSRTAPLPTASPAALLETFVPLNRTPLIASKWIQGDVYMSFAPSRDTSDALVSSEDASAVWFENAASQAAVEAENEKRLALAREHEAEGTKNGTVKDEPSTAAPSTNEPTVEHSTSNNGTPNHASAGHTINDLPPIPAGPTALGFAPNGFRGNPPSLADLPPVPSGPTAPRAPGPPTGPPAGPQDLGRLPPDMPPPPASLYAGQGASNGPLGPMPPAPPSVAAGLNAAGRPPMPPPPPSLVNGRGTGAPTGLPSPPGGRTHGIVDMVEELLNGGQQHASLPPSNASGPIPGQPGQNQVGLPAAPLPESPRLPNGVDIDVEMLLQWKPSNFIDDDEFEACETDTETQLAAELLLQLQYLQRQRLSKSLEMEEPSTEERHIAHKIENILSRLAGDAAGPGEASATKVSSKIPVLLKNYVGTLPSGAPPKLPPPPPMYAGVSMGGGMPGMPNRLASIGRGPNGTQFHGSAANRPRVRR